MAHVIQFKTAKFDISKETPNKINPIAGQSVLVWLQPQLSKAGYTSTEPATEDWGWYMDVEGNGASYLVGASADAHEPTSDLEWTVQVHKTRSVKDKLLGRNKMVTDDPLSALIEKLVRGDTSIEEIVVDKEE